MEMGVLVSCLRPISAPKLTLRITESWWVLYVVELKEAPFQIIHVGAAAPSIPEPLINQASYSSTYR